MRHSPHGTEQALLDLLLERLTFEFVPIRLTGTMLRKSIIDARGPLRTYLARTGLIEYSAIPQGVEHKLQLKLPVVIDGTASMRTVSFYRPNTKQGDPRIWIERLSSVAKEGDLLVFGFSGAQVIPFLVRGNANKVVAALSSFFPSRFEEQGAVERTVSRLVRLLAPIRGKWVRTRRAGPTGVGYTLESMLGVKANVSQLADVDGVELKAYRRGALSGPGKLVTLFSKTPNWLSPEKGIGLLRRYGYIDDARRRRALYCTITCSPNSLGWRLQLRPDAQRLQVSHRDQVAMDYSFRTLETRLHQKHPVTLFIQASSRGSGTREEFRYEEVTLCRLPSFGNFLDLTEENYISLDLTLHEKANGAARDHGYLWRIRESRIPELFAYRRPLT